MASEIEPKYDDIGVLVYNISTITLTKAQKRWRLAYFSVFCSNTIASSSARKLSKKFSRTVAAPSERFSSISQTELTDLMKNKDLKTLHKFNGVGGLAKSLHTNLEHGVNNHDIESRKTAFGSNTYKKQPQKGFFRFVAKAFKDTTIIIQLLCAFLSFGFCIKDNGAKDGWYEGISIFVAVFCIIVASAFSNFRQEKQFHLSSKMIYDDIKIDAKRDGNRQRISIFNLVVGDVVLLCIGDQVPADGLFINGHSLVIDESSMTGRSDPIHIDAINNPFLYSGSKVVDGFAQMLVISVGMNTAWGKMSSSITGDFADEQTPMQSSLYKIVSSFAKVSLAAVLLDLLITLIRYSTRYTKDKHGNWDFKGHCTDTNDILNSFTRAVVATTEGLPLAVTLTFAFCMKRMMFDQAMVKTKSALETMGAVTVICTDKTGTLTLNQMKVQEFCVEIDQLVDDVSSVNKEVLKIYHQGVGLNTTGNICDSGTSCEYSGSPAEKAILSWGVTSLGMDMARLKQDHTILHVETFNSEKKWSGVSIKKEEDSTIHVHWKGAAEIVLAMCSNYYQRDGLIKSINHEEKTRFERIIQGMSARSLTCIAFAHKQNHNEDGAICRSLDEEGLTLLGIIGIKDPCRPGAKEAIDACRSAGVGIKMITGDNVFTAKAIATDCGILEAGPQVSKVEVVEGEEFRNYTDEERMEKVDRIKVMARSTPIDKLLMIQCLKKKGHVIAVTGHATEDAHALKEADVGLSMGIQGTEVAKESSDIIILNDNFASVVKALMCGRCVKNNIQTFIQFQLTANVVALVINFVKAASIGGVPLTPAQQLWANLVINTFGPLALAGEGPAKEVMQKPPENNKAPLITNVMWRNLLLQSVYQIAVLLTIEFGGKSIFMVNESVKNTIIFNTFVMCQVFNLFNSRKQVRKNIFEDLHKNRFFLGIFGVTIILQVVMVEFLNSYADTEKLNIWQWGICIAIAALAWPIGWFVRFIPLPNTPFLSYIKEWV